jgi:alkyl hydroperoxide reductase subunit AhpC
VRDLHKKYAKRGVVVIGVHTPEFAHERDANNVREAIRRLKVPYPVALDNNYAMWRAFHNGAWPTVYVIDRRGVIRYSHVGELHKATAGWSEMTRVIDALLREGT